MGLRWQILGSACLGGAALAIAAFASCGETRLSPIFSIDASITATDTSAPVADVPPVDIVADLPLPDVSPEVPPPIECPTRLVGFAGEEGGTTGGFGGRVVLANTLLELQGYANSSDILTIQIGTRIALTDQVRVQFDNKTIEGVAPGAGLEGGGLNLTDRNNIIVRNLIISNALATDAISVTNARRIWIDHCDLSSNMTEIKGTYDGLVDIVHASDWVTVSWNVFHDHFNVGLIGGSTATAAEDTGHLTVTYHHNWFRDVGSNTPRVRFGTVHVFNNIYENVMNNAIASVMGARVLIEGNVFKNVPDPIRTFYEDPETGTVNERDNVFDSISVKDPALLPTDWVPTYANGYNADPSSVVMTIVPRCAGPQFK